MTRSGLRKINVFNFIDKTQYQILMTEYQLFKKEIMIRLIVLKKQSEEMIYKDCLEILFCIYLPKNNLKNR